MTAEKENSRSPISTPMAATLSVTNPDRVLRNALSPVQNLGSIITKELLKHKTKVEPANNIGSEASQSQSTKDRQLVPPEANKNEGTDTRCSKMKSHLPYPSTISIPSNTNCARPPQHNGRVRQKFIPVSSSGYGKIRRSNSFSISNDISNKTPSSDSEDNGSVSSGRGRKIKRPSSAPVSPVSMAKSMTESHKKSRQLSWAQQQRMKLKERQTRNQSVKIKDTQNKKRATPSSSEQSTPTKPCKSSKISDSCTPTSTSTASCNYNGTNPENNNNQARTPTIMSPLKNSSSKFLAGLRSSGKKKYKSDVTPSRSISKSYALVAATPARIATQSCEIKILSDKVFGPGTGLSDDEIKKLLNSKLVSGTRQWELKKKLDNANNNLKKVKETLNSLLHTKNTFVNDAVSVEKLVRESQARARQRLQTYDAECAMLKNQMKQLQTDNVLLKDNAKDLERDFKISEEKVARLEKEVSGLKEALSSVERAHTQASIAQKIAEGRLEESIKQADRWRAEIGKVEASKLEAVKAAEAAVQYNLEKEMAELREECSSLRTRMQSREEELGRLINNTSGECDSLEEIKRELDRLREKLSESENQLTLREAELTRAISDSEAAAARVAAKDRDMSELMKGLGDIQRSGQAREEEAKTLKKAAEEKAAELDRLLAESRGETSVLTHEKNTLMQSLENCKMSLAAAESSVDILKKEIQDYKSKCNTHDATLQVEKELRHRAEEMEQEERRERIAYSAQMVAMTKEHVKVEAALKEANESLERNWREKVQSEKNLVLEKENALAEVKEQVAGLEGERMSLFKELSDKKTMADAQSVEEIGRLNGEINVLKERLKEADRRQTVFGQESQERVRQLEEQLREGQAERRRMHNTIQELRGNVRVFARVRPFLPGDGVDTSAADPSVVPKNETSLAILKPDDAGQRYEFSFDRVFSPSVGQDAVFQEVSEFIQSALDGYNVCLFSYGQTGSGKTHTMQGSGNGQMRGIIPRAIEQVGEYKQNLEKQGWKYEMRVSFLEIYNETIRDLLRDDKFNEVKHDIKVDSDGRRFVSDLTLKQLEPTDLQAVEDVMRQASKYRSVASTDMNAVSSRSHSVFTLHLTAVHEKQRRALKGTLNLVDLAGSERLDRSGATGDRAREAMAINKSLSSLTDVFAAIGKKSSHIPFRNSKLTYLLQPSLSGDGKTLMMVNLSPTEASFQESLCSLRFASQVNKCELGKPRRSIEDVDDCSTASASTSRSFMSKGARTVKRRLGK